MCYFYFNFFKPLLVLILLVFRIEICSTNVAKNVTFNNEDFVFRVVNGWPAKQGDVPYQIAFKSMVSRYRKMYKTFCGGVLITADKLLSAAHCFEGRGSPCTKTNRASSRKLQSTFAVAGNLRNMAAYNPTYATRQSVEGQWRRLRSMVYPRRYKFPRNDISVGYVTQPFIINEQVAPIPYTTRYADYSGRCLVSGFGRTSKTTTAEVLLLAHLDLVRTRQCSRMHRRNMAKFVCTSTYLADVGKGDSGGPLVCMKTGDPKEGPKGILVGIVSGSRRGVGSFFTRVSSFAPFIARARSSLNAPYKAVVWLCLINGRYISSLYCLID